MVNKDPEVMDDSGPLNSVGTGAGGPGVDRGDETTDKMFSGTRRSKGYELSLIRVAL